MLFRSNGKFVFGPVIKELSKFFRDAATDLPVPVVVKREPNEHDYPVMSMEHRQSAKVKSEGIFQHQIKIENSNEIYGRNSNLSSADYKFAAKFIKKEEKPTSFFSGLNRDVSSIDFNTIDTSQASSSLKSQSNLSLEEFESASKKRKLKMIPNVQTPQEVTFVFFNEPVKVKRSNYEQNVPEDRKDFLEMVKKNSKFLKTFLILHFFYR